MLTELHVRHLGVVDDVALVLDPGLTVITGETGAGKTLLTEAIRLLVGGRAEPHVVRAGADEASVDGRFLDGDDERVLGRVVPADGRSRAYIDGRMAPVSALGEAGEPLVDLHGQNTHQALLSTLAQRRALDAYGNVDLDPLVAARRKVQSLDAELAGLGGDAQSRAREADLLRFQLEEIQGAHLENEHEDEDLLEEETTLADAEAHRTAAATVHESLTGDGGVAESLAVAIKAASGRTPLGDLQTRLKSLSAEVDDIALEAAATEEQLHDDPERLAWVQDRRAMLKSLTRKYGPTLADVIAFRDETQRRLVELESHEETVTRLEGEREAAVAALTEAEVKVREQRQAAAPKLARDVAARLRTLALPHARFEVEVGEAGAGDDVTFLLGPNPGMPALPLAKAASGGELARSMLALRLALLGAGRITGGPDTLIFDEVDAGIGGEAAVAVGQALAELAHSGTAKQVLVVTHLAQVAAFADHQIAVDKQQERGNTVARIRKLESSEREVELARMLSGQPDSASGRAHASELLAHGADVRAGAGTGKRKRS